MVHQSTTGRTYASIICVCAFFVIAFAITVICLDRYTLTNFNSNTLGYCNVFYNPYYPYSSSRNAQYRACWTGAYSTCWFSTSPLNFLQPCAYLYAVGAIALILQAFMCSVTWLDRKWAYICDVTIGSVNVAWWLAAAVYFTNQMSLVVRLSWLPGNNHRIAVLGVIWAAFVVSVVQLGMIIPLVVDGLRRHGTGAGIPQPGSYQSGQQMAHTPMPAYAGPPYGAHQSYPAGYTPQGAHSYPAGYAPQGAYNYPASYAPQGTQIHPAGYAPQSAQSYPAGYAEQGAQSYPAGLAAQAPAGYAPEGAQAPNSYAPLGDQAPAKSPASYEEAPNSYGPQAAQAPNSHATQGAQAPGSYEAPNSYAPQGAQAPPGHTPHGAQAPNSYAPSAPQAAQAPPSHAAQGAQGLDNPFAGATGYAALNAAGHGRWGPP